MLGVRTLFRISHFGFRIFRKSRKAPSGVRRLSFELLETRLVPSAGSNFAASAIVHSVESYTDFVTREYINLLRRLPDPQGLNQFVRAMVNGLSPEAVEAAFVSSPEYILDHGNTRAGFLTGLYRDLLGRAPDTLGFNSWMALLNRGVTAQQVAISFATSPERQSIVVTQDYLMFLGRVPEGGAVTFWVNQLSHGMNRADVESQIIGSNEYFLRQGGTNTNFVIAVYQGVLGRTPSMTEVNFWLNVIGSV